MATRRQVNIYINGKEVANNIRSITAEKRKLQREVNKLTIGTEEYEQKVREIRKLDGVIQDHRKNIRQVETTWSKVSGAIGKFGAVAGVAFGADMIVDYGKKLFDLGAQMELLSQKAETVFAETLPEVTKAARENANAMGLTTSQYIDAAAAVGDLLIPMGFARQEAADISTELVNLSGALSEWTGGQIAAEDVARTLSKAMLGEREELKQLGIAISEADVQARLAEKGMKNLTGEMLQQAKAAATLELITEKSVDAQTAFANNSDTLVRKQAELRARFQDIQETLAQALVPAFTRLLEAAAPVVETTADFIGQLFSAEEPTGRFANAIRSLQQWWEALTARVSAFVNAFRGVLAFFRADFPEAALRAQLAGRQFVNSFLSQINSIKNALGFKGEDFELYDTDAIKEQLATLRGDVEETQDKIDEVFTGTGPRAQARDAKAEERRQKQAEKEARDLEKRLEKLNEIRERFQEENTNALLSEEDRKIAELSAKYDEQIQKALELERQGVEAATAQRLELERQKELALAQLRDEFLQAELEKELEAEEQRAQQQLEFEVARQEARAEIEAATREVLLEERELELLELEEHYAQMMEIARAYGINTADLERAYREEKAEIQRQYFQEERQRVVEQQKMEAEALADAYGTAASVIGGFIEFLGEESTAAAGLSKALALAQIGIKSAEAIASATAASAGVPFPGNLIAIATAVATVLGNIAQARRLIAGTQVPQRFMGGWLDATGATDGRTYRAQYIGQRSSGMLPGHPVLMNTSAGPVLASERGREYFVSNKDLRDPYVMNYVQAIDNIVKYRQFQQGGATAPLSDPGTARTQAGQLTTTELVNVLGNLTAVLRELQQKGVVAVIPDGTVIDINDRFGELNEASGGVL